jgi:16S rRNA (guanine(966)-N(2))-methyltransferase RsmD
LSRIRITGGEWRSRLVEVADGLGLRPTPDRVRETLFNWLGQDLGGLDCLDLFAGSGILGFEAASRGADYVALVESSRSAFSVLKKHADGFECPRLELFCCDALKFVPSSERRFDIVFLDPPYGHGWFGRVESRLDALAATDARIYAEAEMPLTHLGRWSVVKQGRAGQVFFHLLEQA